jgi:hypothetical protein
MLDGIEERNRHLRGLHIAATRLLDLTEQQHTLSKKLEAQTTILMSSYLAAQDAPTQVVSTGDRGGSPAVSSSEWEVVHNGRLIAELQRLGPEIARVAQEAAGAQRKLEEAEARKEELLRG